MLLKKITSILKYFKDFLIGIYIRSKNKEEKLKKKYGFDTKGSPFWKKKIQKIKDFCFFPKNHTVST